MLDTAPRRYELAAFLRRRRERISPAAAGVVGTGRRRTPGLRREEVAQLAGIGVTWYTWLEQGRDIKVSQQVLDAIARTLMFDQDERAHLLTLAGAGEQAAVADVLTLPESVLALLDQVRPFPAVVQSSSYEVLAYNPTYSRLIGNFDELLPENRNCMWLAFTDPAWRKAFPDWDDVAARMVAQFRAGMAEHAAEPVWKAKLARLLAASPDFAAMWERHAVTALQNKSERFRNPHVGLLHFDVINTWLQPHTGTGLLIYTPADVETRRRLDRLVELIETKIV